jgi:hypothetical protein
MASQMYVVFGACALHALGSLWLPASACECCVREITSMTLGGLFAQPPILGVSRLAYGLPILALSRSDGRL